MPALVLGTTFLLGCFAFGERCARPVFRDEYKIDRLAHDLLFFKAKHAVRSSVPTEDRAVRVLHNDCVVVGGQRSELQTIFARSGRCLGPASLGDVDQREHGTVDAVVHGSVWQHARKEPIAVQSADFPLR
ncbi:hypothetical protein AWB81_08574 [Caballeronia arationis]|nr:hypothetical protein AWB81_08574 [Caballeronia arationis]